MSQEVVPAPLPTGAATSALQTTGNTSLGSIDGKIVACDTTNVDVTTCALPSGAATSALQTTGNTSLGSIDGKIVTCNTGAVVVSSSALPSGGATSALQTTGNTSLGSIDGKIVTCNTGAVVVSSSALPTGGATSALQTTGNTSLSSLDGKTVHVDTGAVVVSSSALPSGGATSALQTTGNTTLSTINGKITACNTGAVVVSSSALPSGAATSALQTTGNTSLASIDATTGTFLPNIDTPTSTLNTSLGQIDTDVVAIKTQLTINTGGTFYGVTTVPWQSLRIVDNTIAMSMSQFATTAKVGVVPGTSNVITASPGLRLVNLKGTNSSTTAGFWLLVIDKATNAANNDLPKWSMELPPNTATGPAIAIVPTEFDKTGLVFTNGIAYAISTTAEKVTFPVTSDCMVFARFANWATFGI